MGFSIQITSYLADSWWPSSLHSVSREAWWHSCNKELIAALLPRHPEGSRGLRACVMALTGPGDSTVTVREPAGRLDAVVNRQARKHRQCKRSGVLLIDAYRFPRLRLCKHTTETCMGAWRRAVHAHAKWKHNVVLAAMWQERTQTYRKHTHTTWWILWEPLTALPWASNPSQGAPYTQCNYSFLLTAPAQHNWDGYGGFVT